MQITLTTQIRKSLIATANSERVKSLIDTPLDIIRALNLSNWKNSSDTAAWKAYPGTYVLVQQDGSNLTPQLSFIVGTPSEEWWSSYFCEETDNATDETREDFVSVLVYSNSAASPDDFEFDDEYIYLFPNKSIKAGGKAQVRILSSFSDGILSQTFGHEEVYQNSVSQCQQVIAFLSKTYQIVDTWD